MYFVRFHFSWNLSFIVGIFLQFCTLLQFPLICILAWTYVCGHALRHWAKWKKKLLTPVQTVVKILLILHAQFWSHCTFFVDYAELFAGKEMPIRGISFTQFGREFNHQSLKLQMNVWHNASRCKIQFPWATSLQGLPLNAWCCDRICTSFPFERRHVKGGPYIFWSSFFGTYF